MTEIPVAGPWITEKEVEYVSDAVKRAWYGDADIYHRRFEKAFAEYLGVKHAMALPSCTSAIHLALRALEIGVGDEVIVPDITWVATAAPIKYVGANAVFADVDPSSWCVSPESLDRVITNKTKAIILVDLYGNVPDLDRLLAVAAKHHVHVIEDAAEAIGTEYRGKRAGGFGRVGVFSFHGSKTLTTGEGGMLVTNDSTLFDRVGVLRDHGRKPGDKSFWSTEIAFKYKFSSMQAALGLAQLERIDELITRKRDIFKWYQEELGGVEEVTLNSEANGVKNTYWMVTAILRSRVGLEKEKVISLMKQQQINCRPFFYPLSSVPAFEREPGVDQAQTNNKVSYRLSPYGVNLPSALTLTREQVKKTCDALKNLLSQRE